MVVPVGAERWGTSAPMPLFHLTVPDIIGNGDYSVSPDGTRILFGGISRAFASARWT